MSQPTVGTESYVWRGLDLFEKYADAEAIVTEELRITYAQLRREIFGMATALHGLGIRPGAGVAVLMGTPPEAVILQFALHLLSCRSVWIAPNAPARFGVDFVRRADVGTLIYDSRTHADLGEQLTGALPGLTVLGLGSGAGVDLLATPSVDQPPVDRFPTIGVGGDGAEPQSVFQTGGTTGQPKLVHHGHIFFQTLQLLSAQWLASGGHHLRHLAASGFWHISGQTPAMMTLFTGGTFVPLEEFDVPRVLRTIERERITSLLLSPPRLYELLDHPDLATADLSSVQMLSVGGSAAAPARLSQAIDRLGPVLRPVYGMTEASFITAYPRLARDPAHPQRLASGGLPFGDIRLEIRAPDRPDGAPLPPGEVGEVWLTGGLMMFGYWGQPELTAETIHHGWLRTGDLGYLDEDGYLYLVDRLKDIIITGPGSTNVYARPIEDVLAAHPQVRAAAVVAVPHDIEGESVHAFVVPIADATVTPEELKMYVASELNERWSPREVDLVDALPLTAAGKVDKRALRATYLARHGIVNDGSTHTDSTEYSH